MSTLPSSVHTLNEDELSMIELVFRGFAIAGQFRSARRIDSGLINSTLVVSVAPQSGGVRRYLFQRINESVFSEPVTVMRNVEVVTNHINTKVLRRRADLGGQTLSLVPARDGSSFVRGPGGGVWRCYHFLEGCHTFDVVVHPEQAYQAGHAFGAFQDLVSDLSPDLLVETIPEFHNTRGRFDQLQAAVRADLAGRVDAVRPELAFVAENEEWADRLLGLHAAGEIPLRITHNDTKINNVMFDTETDQAVCVIDLDTVMPGLTLYDFGDLVRTTTNPTEEDERDLGRVAVRMDIFEALTRGFLETAGGILNRTEVEHLAYSGKVIAYELGMRFLTDHLNGDRYFKVKRPGHNLDRARCQLQLARLLDENEAEMNRIVGAVR
jgi:hypothetical protein